MIWLDWLILAILAYNLIGGLINGLLRSLVNLAALIGAYLLTPVLKPVLIALIGNIFGLEEILAVPIGMGITWTVIYLDISMTGAYICKMLNKTPLQIVDRAGGAAFGLLISGILILLPLAAVQAIPLIRDLPPVKETLGKSVCLPVLNPWITSLQTTVGPAVVDYWLQGDRQKMQNPQQTPSAPPPLKKSPLQRKSSPPAQRPHT